MRLTVASMAPISFANEANAPASINIHIIYRIFVLAAPCENIFILSFRGSLLVIMTAQIEAIINATEIGIL